MKSNTTMRTIVPKSALNKRQSECIHNCLIRSPLLLLTEEKAWEILSCVVMSCNVRYLMKNLPCSVCPRTGDQNICKATLPDQHKVGIIMMGTACCVSTHLLSPQVARFPGLFFLCSYTLKVINQLLKDWKQDLLSSANTYSHVAYKA